MCTAAVGNALYENTTTTTTTTITKTKVIRTNLNSVNACHYVALVKADVTALLRYCVTAGYWVLAIQLFILFIPVSEHHARRSHITKPPPYESPRKRLASGRRTCCLKEKKNKEDHRYPRPLSSARLLKT
uniref:Uncharacterized protein n=1 Tax=Glossina brevipalpis TaxID=37001 RepID=A0A1A9WFG5_9MUSC